MSSTAQSEGTFVISPLGIIEDVDDAAYVLLGHAKADLVGMHGSELVPEPQRPATATTIDRMRRGEILSRQTRLLRKDGPAVSVEVEAERLPSNRLALHVRW